MERHAIKSQQKIKNDRYFWLFRTSRFLMEGTQWKIVQTNLRAQVSIFDWDFVGGNHATSDEVIWVKIRNVSNTKSFMDYPEDQKSDATQPVDILATDWFIKVPKFQWGPKWKKWGKYYYGTLSLKIVKNQKQWGFLKFLFHWDSDAKIKNNYDSIASCFEVLEVSMETPKEQIKLVVT